MRTIAVVDYSPDWVLHFERLRAGLAPVLHGVAVAVEHVGSTAVAGLAAKPIIDLDVVVATRANVPRAIELLHTLGYRHRGDLGIAGREAFHSPPGTIEHHLYVCVAESLALRNHLHLRDHLRANPEAARAYGSLKKRLALAFPADIDRYTEAKTRFIVAILERDGFSAAALASIVAANRAADRSGVDATGS